MEQKLNNQYKSKVLYGFICNEPIHPLVPINDFPYKFNIPKRDKFKGKEDPREHLRKFNYSYYIITNDDILILRNFPMILSGQDLD